MELPPDILWIEEHFLDTELVVVQRLDTGLVIEHPLDTGFVVGPHLETGLVMEQPQDNLCNGNCNSCPMQVAGNDSPC